MLAVVYGGSITISSMKLFNSVLIYGNEFLLTNIDWFKKVIVVTLYFK